MPSKTYKLVLASSVVAFIVAIGLLIYAPKSAKAAVLPEDCAFKAHFDRCANRSYYDYLPYDTNFLAAGNGWIWATGNEQIEGAVGTKTVLGKSNGFIDVVTKDLDIIGNPASKSAYQYLSTLVCPAPYTLTQCINNASALVGASYFVNTMMDIGGDDPVFAGAPNKGSPLSNHPKRVLAGINNARSLLPAWSDLVKYYDSKGWVDWKVTIPHCGPSPTPLDPCPAVGAPARLDQVSVNRGIDTAAYINRAPDISQYIRFRNPDGTNYTINKHCGNLTGIPSALVPEHGFTLKPNPHIPEFIPAGDEENPQKAKFPFSISIAGSPVNNIKVTRKYFVDKLVGPDVDILPGRDDNYSFSKDEDRLYTGDTRDIPAGITAGDQICFTLIISFNEGVLDNVTYARGRGITDATGTVLKHGNDRRETSCKRIVNKPYVSFFGNDVYAGGDFNTGGGCINGAGADIKGFLKTDGSSNVFGAGVQFAALAIGGFDQFSSASLKPPGSAGSPDGLKFANQGVMGNFGAAHCIPDYWASAPTTGVEPAIANLGLVAGIHKVPTSGVNTSIIAVGQKLTLYVDGDLTINGNITFNGAGGWSNVDQIPSLYVIVHGNIYIQPGVTQLDGVYIAQPSGVGGGTIYTCADGTTPFSGTELLARCGNRLTVNGAFISANTKLLRTAGSLRDSKTGTTEFGNKKAAEVFNFSPESYLVSPELTNHGFSRYDYIVSLPPVL